MKVLFLLLLSILSCHAAHRTRIGQSDNQSTLATANRMAALFSTLTNNSSITISCWVKYDWTDAQVNANLGGGAFQGLVSKGQFTGGAGTLQFGLFSGSEKLGFSFANPAGTFQTWQTTATTLQTNNWMHVACSYTYSNAASIKFYINGADTSGSWTSGTGNANALTNAVSFHTFIFQQSGSGSSFFIGSMSELGIWTNALSAGDIKKLALGKVKYMPLQVKPESLLFYWPMDTRAIQPPPVQGGDNVDRDRTLTHFDLDAGAPFMGERTLSYQPNE